jgi:hypothetical protein
VKRLEDPFPVRREEHARENLATPRTGRWCRRCRQWLPADRFRPNPRLRGGLDSWCKACHADAVREWRAKNRDEVNARRRQEYRAAHPLPTRPCVVCGKPFTGRPDALVCGQRCRRQRKIEQRRALRAA